MTTVFSVAVLIVGYRNSEDILKCLRSLAVAQVEPGFEIFIAENGGVEAGAHLKDALLSERGCCRAVEDIDFPVRAVEATAQSLLHLVYPGTPDRRVHVATMAENLGYAGAINAWVRPLLKIPGWAGIWVLNPDTEPTPTALAELVSYSERTKKRMVGCRLISNDHPNRVHHRGLAWRKLISKTLAVDFHASITPPPDHAEVSERMDAPSGASMYVTRDLINQIGLMDERYFLYFEDLEWGVRAKQSHDIGYADKSVVSHEGGTTIGSGRDRATMSPLSVFLEFRNRIMFVRENFPKWLPWTILIQTLHAGLFGASGAFRNMMIAYRGIFAGVSGEVGRPDNIMKSSGFRSDRMVIKRYVKIAISGVYWAALNLARIIVSIMGARIAKPFVILYYHGITANNRRSFAGQMAFLTKYSDVVTADWQGSTNSRRNTVAITFDDACNSVFENALPELRSRQLPCTIFVPYGLLGRRADWEVEDPFDELEMVVSETTLKQLADPLVTIGAHSISHPHLNRMQPEDIQVEIGGSRAALEKLLGHPVKLFSFPYGDYNDSVIEICRNEGFQNVFTTVPKPVREETDAFVRGRISVDPQDGYLEFFLKLSGAYAWMEWISPLKRWLTQTTLRFRVFPRIG